MAAVTSTFLAVAFLTLTFAHEVQQDQNEGSTAALMSVPSLETFATYEDMQRYFAHRNLRSLRFIDNPTDDSYISAYNQHNEQPAEVVAEAAAAATSRRSRRASNNQRQLPSEPKLLKFEIADAVEPSDEVKALIRKHRGYELKKLSTAEALEAAPANRNVMQIEPKATGTTLRGRSKRATPAQRPQLQVQFIPFEVSDAREPDARTRELIKRMRALELEQLRSQPKTHLPQAKAQAAARGKSAGKQQQLKRTRRSAPKTPPQMIQIELEDAKAPQESLKAYLQQQQQVRQRKQLRHPAQNLTQVSAAAERLDLQASAADTELEDQQSHESKRLFVYKELPLKAKKSLNSLPHEVQKVISQLMKSDSGSAGAKAYLKYIPTQQLDYGSLKTAYQLAEPHIYAGKLQQPASYVKYVQPLQQTEQLQVHSVPLVEKVRYVYTPVAAPAGGYGAHAPLNIHQPIVVSEAAAATQAHAPLEVHHTYTADLSQLHNEAAAESQHFKQAPLPHFRASKPDQNKLLDSSGEMAAHYAQAQLPVEHYKYEVLTHQPVAELPHSTQQGPLIKIEYHAAPGNGLKDNYMQLQEFKQLSALMGKSPEDQIHGLSYLLAKEMQQQLQSQRQQHADDLKQQTQQQRPQDSTSPIVFHPEQEQEQEQEQQQPQYAQHAPQYASNVDHAALGPSPGSLIGMGKSKQYVPIVEKESPAIGNALEEKDVDAASYQVAQAVEKVAPKAPPASSFIEYGLSPNYEHIGDKGQASKYLFGQMAHQPINAQHGAGGYLAAGKSGGVGVNAHQRGDAGLAHGAAGYDDSDSDDYQGLQYASKYAFGYRIRDFHTGNDFGHKQNRDLDGVTRGQYHILLPDGRIQNVIYHADDTGFHADVSFETGH